MSGSACPSVFAYRAKMLRAFVLSPLVGLVMLVSAQAQNMAFADPQSIRICIAEDLSAPPTPTASVCRSLSGDEKIPSNALRWVLAEIDVAPLPGKAPPLGVVVLGRGARLVFVDGTLIGASGRPASEKDGEVAGPMDSVHLIPTELSRAGPKKVAVLVSGHLNLNSRVEPPVLAIAPFRHPRDIQLQSYALPLAALGAFLSAAIYFGAMGLRQRDRAGNRLVALLCLLLALQLLAEVLRGIWAYPYWMHDVRLGLIWVVALAFGGVLIAVSAQRFRPPIPRLVIGLGMTSSALLSLFAPGADEMTVRATILSALWAFGIAASAVHQDQPSAKRFALAFGVYTLVAFMLSGAFLDIALYAVTALFLGYLFVQQAEDNTRLARAHAGVSERATRLEQALAEASSVASSETVQLKVGRGTENIPVSAIMQCAAAGDYVELQLRDGRKLLANSSLTKLEEILPANFLRVHRSHLVNTAEITALTTESNGSGQIRLANGDTVPVSRRIMPKVRRSI